MDINRWGPSASDNTATAPDGAPEGWYGGDVNAWARETMAQVRSYWEIDDWRDLSQQIGTGTSRYTITRDSDTQLTIGGIDYSSTLFVGQRVKVTNTVAAAVYGVIATVTFSSPNTIVTLTLEEGADADGTAALTTGNISFASNVITRASGSWTADGFVSGDRLRIDGHASNDGFYDVSSIGTTTMTLAPVATAQYTIADASAASGTCYRIQGADTLPAAPLEGFFVTGPHVAPVTKQAQTGANPLDYVTHEMLGDAAYKREADLSVLDSTKLNGDTQGSGGGIDADTVDGLHATDFGLTREWGLSGNFTITDTSSSQLITGLSNLTLPGTPDGSKRYSISCWLRMDGLSTIGGSGDHQAWFRLHNGSLGTDSDPIVVTSTTKSFGLGNFEHFAMLNNYIITPTAGNTKLSFSYLLNKDVSQTYTGSMYITGGTPLFDAANSIDGIAPDFARSRVIVTLLEN